ncbi:MAG: tetratricopeptide repeat protein [Spirochaetaceae bacterium]|jgi:tetratricopeptide (TPR) repeat protein|nr:tetratricopeptide repeat protein [Spirochaetaceae bacterium]
MMKGFRSVIFAAGTAWFLSVLSCGTTGVREVRESPPAPAAPAPESTLAFAMRVQDTLDAGTVKDAISLFDTVDPETASAAGVRLMLASLLLSDNQLSQAEEIAAGLITDNPGDTDALVLAALIAKAAGKGVQKRQYIARALELDPSNPGANVELGDEQMLRRNYGRAARYYAKALEGDPKSPAALFGLGKSSYYLGNLKAAEGAFRTMTVLCPGESAPWAYLAKLETEKNDHKKAQSYLEKALGIDPGSYDALLDYGQNQRAQGNLPQAASAWERAVKVDPNYFLAYEYLAGVYDDMGQFDRSLKNYRMVARTNPEYFYAYESIGVSAWKTGNWKECRQALMKAREYNPGTISYPLLIFAAYCREGNRAEARNYLAQVMRNMDRSTLEYALARLYFDNINESSVVQKIMGESSVNTRGKLLYYMGLYYDINGAPDMARNFYLQVNEIIAPMFVEYRLNEWALGRS